MGNGFHGNNIQFIHSIQLTNQYKSFSRQATDADLGINANLSYVIENGNLDNSFVINGDTGAIATTKALDREHRTSYSLLITVSDLHGNDAGGIPLKDSAIVEVTIQVRYEIHC